jgi:hypothetical protein
LVVIVAGVYYISHISNYYRDILFYT